MWTWINSCPACQVLLVYPVAKFLKTFLQCDLMSYNKKSWQEEKCGTQAPLTTVSQECIYYTAVKNP